MKTKGFTLMELMVVLIILTVLALLILPPMKHYVQRAKFSDNIVAANAIKDDVEMCYMRNGAACIPGTQNMVPALITNYGGTVSSVAVSSDLKTITATSTAVFGKDDNAAYTLILKREINANDVTVYSIDPSSTCIAAKLC